MTQLYSFYRQVDGIFTGDTYAGMDVGAATPAGCAAMAGRYSPSAQRVDLFTGQVVAWQCPPPPSDTYTAWVWSSEAGQWLPELTTAGLARVVRADRDARLAACDWVVIRAAEQGSSISAQWLDYRAALRAVPDQAGFPGQVTWPVVPS